MDEEGKKEKIFVVTYKNLRPLLLLNMAPRLSIFASICRNGEINSRSRISQHYFYVASFTLASILK